MLNFINYYCDMVEKLKIYIQDNGLKKTKVAEMLGVSLGHLSYVINGVRPLSIELEDRIRELIK